MRLVNLIPLKEMENPCWKDYQMVGTKKKDGREVPNCVPNNEAADSAAINQPGGFVGDDGDNKNIDEINEYDVENEQDMKEFIHFMREYKQQLSEATCDCLLEAEYQGHSVPLGKPMQGDVKKFKVYVKNDKGKVVKVNFGFGGKSAHGKVMKIKKNNPERRRSFRARHHCENPGPRWKPRYWACRTW